MSNEALIAEARTIQAGLGGDDKAATDARNVIGDLLKALEQSEWVSVEDAMKIFYSQNDGRWGVNKDECFIGGYEAGLLAKPITPPPAEVET